MKTKFQVTERPGLHGIDILAKNDGRTLGVEVKGDRPGHVSSRATINVDVMTLLGKILLRSRPCTLRRTLIPAPAYRVPGPLERVNDS
jgi:hypothetical protein